jgi:hypothetical protein
MLFKTVKLPVCFLDLTFRNHLPGFSNMMGGAPVQVLGVLTFMASGFLTHIHTPSITLIFYECYKVFDNIIRDLLCAVMTPVVRNSAK